MKADLPCAVCKTELESSIHNKPDMPSNANIFTSTGHYGATAYDSMGPEHIELYICTDCLDEMRDNKVINVVRTVNPSPIISKKTW